MIEFFGFVMSSLKSTFSNAEILINVATSVIEYGLLKSAFILAINRYAMMATQESHGQVRWFISLSRISGPVQYDFFVVYGVQS